MPSRRSNKAIDIISKHDHTISQNSLNHIPKSFFSISSAKFDYYSPLLGLYSTCDMVHIGYGLPITQAYAFTQQSYYTTFFLAGTGLQLLTIVDTTNFGGYHHF